ncbi:MAG: hypothetical protein VKM98_10430 [Cyanobacteriota bacterium]|nr:hypothetical protein [Cyanobacteriota bacterium]
MRPAATALILLSEVLLLGLAPAQAGPNMKDQLIVYFCSRAIRAEFQKAGKTPPAGMVASTCDCVVQKVAARASIEEAKAICRANAQKTFAVE